MKKNYNTIIRQTKKEKDELKWLASECKKSQTQLIQDLIRDLRQQKLNERFVYTPLIK